MCLHRIRLHPAIPAQVPVPAASSAAVTAAQAQAADLAAAAGQREAINAITKIAGIAKIGD